HDLATRRVFARYQKQFAVWPEYRLHGLVLESSEWCPFTVVRVSKVVLKFPTVAVLHRREHARRTRMEIQLDLRDARQFVAELVPMSVGGRAKRVEIKLLEEIHVFRGPLVATRIPRVIKAFSIWHPN